MLLFSYEVIKSNVLGTKKLIYFKNCMFFIIFFIHGGHHVFTCATHAGLMTCLGPAGLDPTQ